MARLLARHPLSTFYTFAAAHQPRKADRISDLPDEAYGLSVFYNFSHPI
jgi:hypothetical protein